MELYEYFNWLAAYEYAMAQMPSINDVPGIETVPGIERVPG